MENELAAFGYNRDGKRGDPDASRVGRDSAGGVRSNPGEGVHGAEDPLCDSAQYLLDAARVKLPPIIPSMGVSVTTKKKLPERRKKN